MPLFVVGTELLTRYFRATFGLLSGFSQATLGLLTGYFAVGTELVYLIFLRDPKP